MTALHVDFETRSACDLKVTGLYVYAAHPSTDVHCMAYSFDDEPVELWRRGEPIPPRVEMHITLGGIIFAHNAQFERAIFRHVMAKRYGWPDPDVEQWRCTMVMAYAMALPGALEHLGPALNTGFEKDMVGNRLMLAMSRPRRPKKGEPTDVVLWREEPADLARLYSYCEADVEAERAGDKRLVRLRPSEQALWHLDQRVNDRGVPVDAQLARRNLAIVEAHTRKLDREIAQVTDYEVNACSNVNHLKVFLKNRGVQLGEKLNKATGVYTETLDKESVAVILAGDIDPAARRALELRQEGGKASVDKIDALLNGMDTDGRARGLLQFHAANTGRWGGRRFQPQNILRPDEDFDVDGAIDVILNHPTARAMDILDAMFGTPITCVSYTLRGMVAAPKGRKIVAADFNNIEGVVLAWLAGERPRLHAFREYFAKRGPDLYLVAASGIYGIPVGQMSKKTHPEERQIGKVAELACGYGGGVGAFQTMAATYGVTVPDDQANEIKNAWRDANPAIVAFWQDLEDAALEAIRHPGRAVGAGPITYKVVGSFLWCRLPSGRALCYAYPKVYAVKTPWGQMKDAVTFKTVPNVSNRKKIVWDDTTNSNKWARISTYGGALCENVTQAVARDLLAEAMVRLEGANYPIILTVHDENVSEVDEGFGSAKDYEEIMCELPDWAGGLPIAASGFEAERYRK